MPPAVRQTTVARSTGTEVTVEDTLHPDANAGHEEDRWAVVCWGVPGSEEPHGGVCSFPTLADARAFAPHPEEWCPVCQETADPDAHTRPPGAA